MQRIKQTSSLINAIEIIHHLAHSATTAINRAAMPAIGAPSLASVATGAAPVEVALPALALPFAVLDPLAILSDVESVPVDCTLCPMLELLSPFKFGAGVGFPSTPGTRV